MSDHAASSSPEDWATVLDAIHARLQEAMAAAEARLQSSPPPVEAEPQRANRVDLDRLTAYLHGTREYAERAQAVADEADRALAATEAALQRRQADAESLRHRLAAWAARAIG